MVAVWSLRDRRFKYLPTSLLYFSTAAPARPTRIPTAARAGTLGEAVVQGFLELVERDSNLVVQSLAAEASHTSTGSKMPTFAICRLCLPKPDAGFGCSTSPTISGSELRGDGALDERRQGKHRVPGPVALRCAHCHVALTSSINSCRSVLWAAQAAQVEPRRNHAISSEGLSLLAKRRSAGQPRSDAKFSRLDARSRSPRACASRSAMASPDLSSSIRRAPTSRSQWPR